MKVAVLQCEPGPPDLDAGLTRLERKVAEAKDRDATVLVTPEMFLSGYNIGARRVRSLAEIDGGQCLSSAGEIAAHHGVAVLFGYPAISEDGQVYNTVALIDAEGSIVAQYHKSHLYGEVDRAQFSPGDTIGSAFDFQGWSVALSICYDIEFPEVARAQALAGAGVLLVPTANMIPYDSVATTLVPARAEENAVFVAYANYVGEEGEFRYFGKSCICGPDGAELARAGSGVELITADIDASYFKQVRKVSTHLQDRRPDLYGKVTRG